VSISVNVSAAEFRSQDFVESVSATLLESGLEPRYLELELTEGVLMDDAEFTASVLKNLKAMGVHLAVDDFGTGYSSLSYLRKFPIDVLKIDRSFVTQITAESDDSTIVNAIINMGKSLKYLVVAEGIETQEQRGYLQSRHCEEGKAIFQQTFARHTIFSFASERHQRTGTLLIGDFALRPSRYAPREADLLTCQPSEHIGGIDPQPRSIPLPA
jgi:EAL domain-containing protein (putative c-di-GMP-specific phosphodiesterase class I)